jgi:hypothetical protein
MEEQLVPPEVLRFPRSFLGKRHAFRTTAKME